MQTIKHFFSLFIFIFSLLHTEKSVAADMKHTHPIQNFNINVLTKTSSVKPPLMPSKSIIMLDPGHGGHDVGTQSLTVPRYQEKSFNLVTAQFVKSYLQQKGYRVVMTREEDKFISLQRRTKIANDQNPILFVSIHYNSAPSIEAQGIEVFYFESPDNKIRTAKSKKLAQAILKYTLIQTGAKSRKIKHGNYAVIRETKMPAVLIEGGFLTNESEMQKIKDPAYLKKLAQGIVDGIIEYLKN